MSADQLLDPVSAVAADVGADALALFDGDAGHGLVEVGAGLGVAVGDEVVDLFGLRALEEHRVGLVGVLVGVVSLWLVVLLIGVLVVLLLAVVGVGAELLLLLGIVLVGGVASEVGVVVGVHLHEIVGVVLLLAESVLLLGLLRPNKILILIHPAVLELIQELLGPLDLLSPLQRAILRRTHELPLHLLLTRKGNNQLLLLVGD